jgi:hypothetical protein
MKRFIGWFFAETAKKSKFPAGAVACGTISKPLQRLAGQRWGAFVKRVHEHAL